MATKIDRTELCRRVPLPFHKLADKIEERHIPALVSKWVKEEFRPRVERWEAADPVLFKSNAKDPSLGSSYIYIDDTPYNLPTDRLWPKNIPSNTLTKLDELIEKASGEVKEELEQAKALRVKAQMVRSHLWSFLGDKDEGGFTSIEQAIFSLPELKGFAPAKCASQKRPRVFKVPSNELRRLMMEAVRLKQALQGEHDDE